MPGIKITGGFACAEAHKAQTAITVVAAAEYAIFLSLVFIETRSLLNFLISTLNVRRYDAIAGGLIHQPFTKIIGKLLYSRLNWPGCGVTEGTK